MVVRLSFGLLYPLWLNNRVESQHLTKRLSYRGRNKLLYSIDFKELFFSKLADEKTMLHWDYRLPASIDSNINFSTLNQLEELFKTGDIEKFETAFNKFIEHVKQIDLQGHKLKLRI